MICLIKVWVKGNLLSSILEYFQILTAFKIKCRTHSGALLCGNIFTRKLFLKHGILYTTLSPTETKAFSSELYYHWKAHFSTRSSHNYIVQYLTGATYNRNVRKTI